jgi:hypothetical protein
VFTASFHAGFQRIVALTYVPAVSGNVLGASDSFAITVSDGHGGTITTPLTV